MGLFGQAKDLYKLQKKAKQIKEQLKNLHIEAEVEGVKIIINAEQEVQEIIIDASLLDPSQKDKLEATLKTVINKAVKKAQEVAAEQMRGMMGDLGMNLPNGEDPSAQA